MGEPATSLGARLRASRREAGLSQGALAKRAALTDRYIRNLERRGSTNSPTIGTVQRLAAAMGVTPAWLAFGQGERVAASPAVAVPSYEIMDVDGYELLTDTITLDVDCVDPYARSYRIEWCPTGDVDCERLAIKSHWQVDGEGLQPRTHDLDPAEVRDLRRWLDSSDEVATRVKIERAKAMEREDPRP